MSAGKVVTVSDAEFETSVVQNEKPAIVDFWAEWCQPCQMLTPTIEELATDYADRVKVGKVDTDANREVPVKYGINAIPTIILFQGGEVKKKFVGLTSKEQFQEAIDELMA